MLKNEKNFSFNLTPANMIGLGAAATPAGISAFRELEKLEEERRESEKHDEKYEKGNFANQRKSGVKNFIAQPKGTASNEMCTFLILNISSLQLIPVNIIAYRSQYGSANPAAIVATFASTLAAVVFCKVMDRKNR